MASLEYPPSRWGSRLAYCYLLRIPLLLGFVLAAFPFAALVSTSPLHALFENLFFLDAAATFLTTVVAVVLAWSLVLTARLVFLNGDLRFGVIQMIRQKDFQWWWWLITLALAAPAVAGQFFERGEFHLSSTEIWHNALAAVAGVAFAYLLGYGSLWLAILVSPKGSQPDTSTFPTIKPMEDGLAWANHHTALPNWFTTWLRRCLAKLPADLRAGYLDNRARLDDGSDNGGYGLPWASHWLAFSFAFLTFALYLWIGAYKKAHLGETTSIPALAMVLFLLLNLNWVLSFVTFLLDRFRVPLLIPLGMLAVLGTYFPSSDRYYQIHSGVTVSTIRPHEALQQRAGRKPIIIVATAGGGIQAAAWTTRVLTGLQHESQSWQHGSFADSVALISSVSGGATGSLFFLNQYGSGNGHPGFQLPDHDDNFSKLVELASAPALDDVAWALVYRDLPGLIVPWSASVEDELLDRGRMLELAWQNRTRNFGNLSAWRDGVKEGWRPAAIFNATIAETGEPLLLSTTDFDRKGARRLNPAAAQPDRKTFYDLYPGADLPVVTAVRLAASFPYVSPAARAQTSQPEYHVIDGGYYDNYGVASAVEWIDEAFAEMKDPPDVLVIQIRSFPNDPLPAAQNRGWFFQAHAPLTGLLSERTTAQLVRDRDDLRLLQQRWWGPQAVPRLRFAGFQFTATDAPLSWKMNKSQMDAIDQAWLQIVRANGYDLQQVRCMFEPSGEKCPELARLKGPW